MSKIKILIADSSYLIRKGLASLINKRKDFSLVAEVEKAEELNEQLMLHQPKVLIIDYSSCNFCLDDISVIHHYFPEVKILAITYPQSKAVIAKVIESGVTSHLLKDCGEDEIIESIYYTAKDQKFMCSKIVDVLLENKNIRSSKESCEGVKLSDREIQIIQLIAEGLANKQIADKLFISPHTVMTHRKHVMSKLGINNTASLVMYAIRENLIHSALSLN